MATPIKTTGTQEGDIAAGYIQNGAYASTPLTNMVGMLSKNNPVPPAVPDQNAALNNAQSSAFDALSGNPLSDTDAARARANDIITKATSNINSLTPLYQGATVGANSIAERTKSLYGAYGIEKPDFTVLNKELADATVEYKNLLAKKTDNITQREQQLAGGGTNDAAKSLDTLDQRNISLQSLAAATRMQVAQQALNNATDIFKELSSQSEKEQTNYIATISDQLNLNKADLSAGVQLMNQAIQEAHGDAVAAKSLIVGLAQNYPNFFEKLTPQDQAALTQGQITPSILATIGTLQTNKETQLAISQQNADTARARELAYVANLVTGGGGGITADDLTAALAPLNGGATYLDPSQFSNKNDKRKAEDLARQNGITVLANAADRSVVNNVNTAISNLKSTVQSFVAVAPKNFMDKFNQTFENRGSKLFNTDFGNKINAYETNRDSLFQQINALAGSHPRINAAELQSAANALPKIGGINADTTKAGLTKANKTLDYLGNSARTFIPNYPYQVFGTDGVLYNFPSLDAANQYKTKKGI